MGRAGQTLKDSFAHVLGNKRGLKLSQERELVLARQVEYNTLLFSPKTKVAERRLALLKWWLYSPTAKEEVIGLAAIMDFTQLYLPSHDYISKNRCKSDVEELVKRGMIMDITGPGSYHLGYRLKPLEEWPDEHREAYLIWEKQSPLQPWEGN